MRTFSEKFPPINRISSGLGTIDIDIQDAKGVKRYSPNTLAIALIEGELSHLEPIPGVSSVISKKPAFGYTTDEVQLALTFEELTRLVGRSLRPAEFFTLAVKYGVFFEIHDDFYDEDTGKALQPADETEPVADIRVSKTGDWVEVVDGEGTVIHGGHSIGHNDLVRILAHFGIDAEVIPDYSFE